MSGDFDLADLRRILENCREYEPGHPLGRPFMSAYQIAIRFAEVHENHILVQTLPLGGQGTGNQQSLAQRIAWFLSRATQDAANGIEGGFISHDCIDELSFNHANGEVRVSTLKTRPAHSIFRVTG